MKKSTPSRANLVCPACRTAEGWHALAWADITEIRGERVIHGALGCPHCNHRYPVVDEVATLVPIPPEQPAHDPSLHCYLWADSDQANTLPPGLNPGPPPWTLLQPHLRPTHRLLDFGCGTGGATYALAPQEGFSLGVDLWESRVKAAIANPKYEQHPVDFVLADAMDPPLGPENWDAVMLNGVWDVARDPIVLLGQSGAMLPLGGLLFVSTPYQFSGDYRPQDPKADLRQHLGTGTAWCWFEAVDQAERLWVLRDNARRLFVYEMDVVIGRKVPAPTG